MAKLIGNAPNQVPTNADLGSMAFEDRTNYITKGASVHQPYRNIIINGDMSIAQRGTSVSGITSSGSGTVYSVDRMALALSGAGTWTMSQETDVPSGQGFAKSVKILCTANQPSISSGGYLTFMQKFEGQNLQYLKYGTSNAENLTLSFWIKSSKTGNFVAELANRDSSIYIGRIISINNADTWEKKTVTYEGYTTANLDNDNDWSMDVQIWFGSGTAWNNLAYSGVWQSSNSRRASGLDLQLQDTTNANVYLTGLQLEAGTTASDFEFLPYDMNLDRCLRYYELVASGLDKYFVNGHYYNSTYIRTVYTYRKIMRATPSLDIVSGTDYYRIVRNNSSDTFDDLTLTTGTEKAGLLINTTDVSGTGGQAGDIRTSNASAYIAFNAEL